MVRLVGQLRSSQLVPSLALVSSSELEALCDKMRLISPFPSSLDTSISISISLSLSSRGRALSFFFAFRLFSLLFVAFALTPSRPCHCYILSPLLSSLLSSRLVPARLSPLASSVPGSNLYPLLAVTCPSPLSHRRLCARACVCTCLCVCLSISDLNQGT